MQGGILLLAVTAALGLRVAKEIEENVCYYVFFCKYVWGLGREVPVGSIGPSHNSIEFTE